MEVFPVFLEADLSIKTMKEPQYNPILFCIFGSFLFFISQCCSFHVLSFLFFFCLATDWMLDRDPQEEIYKAFRLFDDDQTGKISLRNLRRVARELGENMSDEELRSMIDEFDKDGDGESKCYFFFFQGRN